MSQELSRGSVEVQVEGGLQKNNLLLRALHSEVIKSLFELDINASQGYTEGGGYTNVDF